MADLDIDKLEKIGDRLVDDTIDGFALRVKALLMCGVINEAEAVYLTQSICASMILGVALLFPGHVARIALGESEMTKKTVAEIVGAQYGGDLEQSRH